MRELLLVLVVGVASALVPVVNIEAYLSVRAAVAVVDSVWLLGLAAAVGQMAGKTAWYFLGASALSWGWIRRRAERPRARARLELWRARVHDRPGMAGALVFVSAFSGLPPFAVLAVLAGQLRLSLALFLVLGLAGRWLRFAAVLGGAGALSRLLW